MPDFRLFLPITNSAAALFLYKVNTLSPGWSACTVSSGIKPAAFAISAALAAVSRSVLHAFKKCLYPWLNDSISLNLSIVISFLAEKEAAASFLVLLLSV